MCHPIENLDAYIRGFHERALNCCDLVAKEVFVDICLYCMLEEYMSFLKNLFLSSFSRSMKLLIASSHCAGPRGPVQQLDPFIVP